VNQAGHGDEAASDITAQDIEARLRDALRDALKTRDVVAAFALRSALGAIANAGAVPADPAGGPTGPLSTAPPAGGAYVAKAAAGAGATEVGRRQLGPADLREIVGAEISEREITAGQYEGAGHADRAERLRREAQILRAVLES
jgi:uncharacterized protein